MIGIGLGIIRAFTINSRLVTDLLPVDYVVNLILAAASDVASTSNNIARKDSVAIFNCVSGVDAPITWGWLRSKFKQ